MTLKGAIPEVRSGVKFGNGDGTIPAISLGGMCVRGWKGKTPWNPAGIKVVTQGMSDFLPSGSEAGKPSDPGVGKPRIKG